MTKNHTSVDALMQGMRFADALCELDKNIQTEPDNLSLWLKKAVCTLLCRGEAAFLSLKDDIEAVAAKTGQISGRLASQWAEYKRLCRVVGAAALVLGAAAYNTPADASEMMVLYGVFPPEKRIEAEQPVPPVKPEKKTTKDTDNGTSPIPPYGAALPHDLPDYDKEPIKPFPPDDDPAMMMPEYGLNIMDREILPRPPADDDANDHGEMLMKYGAPPM